jgi:hypothetical protein
VTSVRILGDQLLEAHPAMAHALRANPRLGPAVLGRRRLGAAERRAVRASAQGLLARLDRA